MKVFDTHAHLDDSRFDEDREALIAALPGEGVVRCMTIGASMETSANAVALANRWPHLWAAVGVHPHEAALLCDEQMDTLRSWAGEDRVVAIGEIGLDYHYDLQPRETQRACLDQQFTLAREVSLPVIYHIREAWGDFLPWLKAAPRHPGVMHCYSGSVETAKLCLDAGLYLSLAGTVTFKNARNLQEVARYVPADRLLIETDCPYLTPEPLRGRRNEPKHVLHTARAVAALCGEDPEAFAWRALENGCRLFGIPLPQ